MPQRTITIKGTGQASARPDEIYILLGLDTHRPQYQETMTLLSTQHDALIRALAPCGIAKEEIKTTVFKVDTVYESERDGEGTYKNRFAGYRCMHQMRVAIPMDLRRLGALLSAIAESGAEPELNLRFTVHHAEALKDEVLRSATVNARRRAELLADAAGVRLGELMNIEHTWGETDAYSPVTIAPRLAKAMSMDIVIEPEDVKLSDTVTFTWALA